MDNLPAGLTRRYGLNPNATLTVNRDHGNPVWAVLSDEELTVYFVADDWARDQLLPSMYPIILAPGLQTVNLLPLDEVDASALDIIIFCGEHPRG